MRSVSAVLVPLIAASMMVAAALIITRRRTGQRVPKAIGIVLICWFGALAVASLANGAVLVIADLSHP